MYLKAQFIALAKSSAARTKSTGPLSLDIWAKLRPVHTKLDGAGHEHTYGVQRSNQGTFIGDKRWHNL